MIVVVSLAVITALAVAYTAAGPVGVIALAIGVCVFFDWRTRVLRGRR